MESYDQNREAVTTIGDLIESLFGEVQGLPLSDAAKNALVMIMLGDTLKRQGRTIYFNYPAQLKGEAAA